jgi:hypothetical protein
MTRCCRIAATIDFSSEKRRYHSTDKCKQPSLALKSPMGTAFRSSSRLESSAAGQDLNAVITSDSSPLRLPSLSLLRHGPLSSNPHRSTRIDRYLSLGALDPILIVAYTNNRSGHGTGASWTARPPASTRLPSSASPCA